MNTLEMSNVSRTITVVVPLRDGKTAIRFTFFRPADLPMEVYERQLQSLLTEMDGMAKRFAARE